MFSMPDSVVVMETPPPCTRVADPDLFFPATDGRVAAKPTADERRALKVCAGCPLAARAACLTAALDAAPAWHQYGVIGGTTASQRKAILKKTSVTSSTVVRTAELAEVA